MATRCFRVITLAPGVYVFRTKEGTLDAEDIRQLLADMGELFRSAPVYLVVDCRDTNVLRSLVHITREAVIDVRREKLRCLYVLSDCPALTVVGQALIKARNATGHVKLIADPLDCPWDLGD